MSNQPNHGSQLFFLGCMHYLGEDAKEQLHADILVAYGKFVKDTPRYECCKANARLISNYMFANLLDPTKPESWAAGYMWGRPKRTRVRPTKDDKQYLKDMGVIW